MDVARRLRRPLWAANRLFYTVCNIDQTQAGLSATLTPIDGIVTLVKFMRPPSPVRAPAPARRVLCVDDDPAMQEFMVWKFQSAGFRPVAVSSGSDALRFAATHRFDLFVFDYQMPEMNGEELAIELRRRFPRIALLMISGDSAVPESARKIVDHFMFKGIGFGNELISEASRLLRESSRAA